MTNDALAENGGGGPGSGVSQDQRRALARTTQRHAFGWLVAANLVGLGLSLILIWPELNDLMAPLTYGRWMPVHLNGQLYGWCALPLVGLLLFAFLDLRHPQAVIHAQIALAAWTLALVAGSASWLMGNTSGKLFLDWQGWARPLLPAAMVVLWTVLAAHGWWCWRVRTGGPTAPRDTWTHAMRAGLLSMLLPLPALIHWSSGPDVYPAVNPGTGGATGASLLGSTLGMVTIFGALPLLLGVPRAKPSAMRVGTWFFGLALVASWFVYGMIDHGHASHESRDQILGLGTLFIWIPLAWTHLSAYAWAARARPWLAAAFGWWTLLVVTGWLTFLPGWSDPLKFTHALVAHAHLAMAGFVTAINQALLLSLEPGESPGRRSKGADAAFWVWQGSLALQLITLFSLALVESLDLADLFYAGPWTTLLFALRAITGTAMLVASACWLRRAWQNGASDRETEKTESPRSAKASTTICQERSEIR